MYALIRMSQRNNNKKTLCRKSDCARAWKFRRRQANWRAVESNGRSDSTDSCYTGGVALPQYRLGARATLIGVAATPIVSAAPTTTIQGAT